MLIFKQKEETSKMRQAKVGQKVRISRNPIWPDDPPEFVSGMDKWKGKIVTISRITGKDKYRIEEDGGEWIWSARWFEPVYEEEGEIVELKDEIATVYDVYKKGSKIVRETNKQVKINELFERVVEKVSVITPLLPPGTRFYQRSGNKEIVVVENQPQVRSVRVAYVGDVGEGVSLRLAFPYTIFVIVFSNGSLKSVHFFYRTVPLTSLDDDIYYSNLPNIDNEASVCMDVPDFPEGASLAYKVNKVMEVFWQSEFNSDLRDGYDWARDRDERIAGFYKWQKSSSKDPLFMLEISWKIFNRLKDALGNIEVSHLPVSGAEVIDIIYQI